MGELLRGRNYFLASFREPEIPVAVLALSHQEVVCHREWCTCTWCFPKDRLVVDPLVLHLEMLLEMETS